MKFKSVLIFAIALVAGVLVYRWVITFNQTSDEAFVREPAQIFFGPAVPVFDTARELYPYAILSANVYQGSWMPERNTVQSSSSSIATILPLPGWKRWLNFPSKEFQADAFANGLYCEVWESTATVNRIIAVVFKGTDFDSKADWKSNLRWITRFVPGYQDQYTLLSKRLGNEFVEEMGNRKAELSDSVTVVATGHSLGGGLAQHFAYSLPLASSVGTEIKRISHVYAFDPSPVTGWFNVDSKLRSHNARGLKIDRVYEKGEVLVYIRAIMRWMYMFSDKNPAIREIRYNFVRSGNVIKSHSMSQLAQNLMHAAENID